MKTCNICFNSTNKKNNVKLKCCHTFCISCFEKWLDTLDEKGESRPREMINKGVKTVTCPCCRREYLKILNDTDYLESTKRYHYKSIIAKINFSNQYFYLVEPMEIFTLTCKHQIYKKDGLFYFKEDLFRMFNVIVHLLIPIYESNDYKEPLNLYCYKQEKVGNISIILKSVLSDTLEMLNSIEAFLNLEKPEAINEFIDYFLINPELVKWF